jgi:NAD(P)-dependent dehydrogenase (short-subunit alcohol dehydrogenase family)
VTTTLRAALNGPRVAIVTGGARGIGAAVARRLSADGWSVAVADLDTAGAESVAAGLATPSVGLSMDVTSPESVSDAIDRIERSLGAVRSLAACAGVVELGPFETMSRSRWDRTLGVNAWGTYVCLTAVAERLKRSGSGGSMVAIASIAARGPNPVAPDYGASKAAVVNLVRSAAVVYAPNGITVNAVCPGIIDTEMVHQVHARVGELTGRTADEALADRVSTIPLGRIGRPEDVAAAIALLLSDDAAYVTGQALNVCGGLEFD